MDTFILDLFQLNDKLRPKTLYQILIGKRTSSVLTAAFFHDVLPYFSCCPKLSEKQFAAIVTDLVVRQELIKKNDDRICLNKLRPIKLNDSPYCFFDGFMYGRQDENCWRMIQFMVQVASYQQITTKYVPLETMPLFTETVRQLVKTSPQFKNQIYHELFTIFQTLPETIANFLAGTFSGYQQTGKAMFQLLPKNAQAAPWDHLYARSCIHAFLIQLQKQPSFLLFQGVREILMGNYNQSVLPTIDLFKKGVSFEEVCQSRNLKPGTINDHLIEWALMDKAFDFDSVLSSKEQEILSSLPQESFRKSYKELFQSYPVAFFSLRLYQIKLKRSEERPC